jgi:hypothetical protein
MNKIKFVVKAVKWFDKVNGNTYHSVRITRCKDGKVLKCKMQYGYGNQYTQTALDAMGKAGWIPAKYMERTTSGIIKTYLFERENNYPILWEECNGTKKECRANGE